MTLATNILFAASGAEESPETAKFSCLRRDEIPSLFGSSSSESFASSTASTTSDEEEDEEYVTYISLNDIEEPQESLIDMPSDSEEGDSMIRENSDDSLFQMLTDAGFSCKKRVTFKPMVKVIHFECKELEEEFELEEIERQRAAKIAEESKSFVSNVKFFVGNTSSNSSDDDYFSGFGY